MKNLEIFKYLVFIAVLCEGVNSLFIPTVPSNYFTNCPASLVCTSLENCPVQQRATIGFVQDDQQQYIKCLAQVSSSSSNNNDNFISIKRDMEIINGKLYKYGVCCSQESFSILPPSPIDFETNEVQRVLHRYHRNKRSVNYNNNYSNLRRRRQPEAEEVSPVSTDTTLLPETSKFGPIVSYPKTQTSSVSTPIIDTMTQMMNDNNTDSTPSTSPDELEGVGKSGLNLLGRAHEDGDENSKTSTAKLPPSSSSMSPLNQTQQQQQQASSKNASAPYNQQRYSSSSYSRPPPPPQYNRPPPYNNNKAPPMAQPPRPNYNQNRNNIAPTPVINNVNSSQPQKMNNSNPSNQMAVPSTQPNTYQKAQPANLYNSNNYKQENQNKANQNQNYQPKYPVPRYYQPPQNNYQPPQNNYQAPQNNYPQNNYQPPQNNYPQNNYQSPQNTYPPPQNNYQPPQNNYQQNTYQPPQNNYPPPQNNYQQSAPYYQQKPQQQYYEMKPRQSPNTQYKPYNTQQQQKSPYASYPVNSMGNKNPKAFAFPIVSETNEPRPFPVPASSYPRYQQPQQQQQQQNSYQNYQYGPGNVRPSLNRQRRRSPSFFSRRRYTYRNQL